jgi:AAA family ATP:ADP antiporter
MNSLSLSTTRFITRFANAKPLEVHAAVLAFSCNFLLMASYYLLRPVRDTMATVFGAAHLQELFTGTLVLTLVCTPLFAWVTDSFKLSRVLPGVFWFLIANLLVFDLCFQAAPESRWLAAAFFWWFSVVNLFMVSVFWSLVVDVFTPSQATRLLPGIAGGGSLGAIAGPLIASAFANRVGVGGLLLIAAAGLGLVIVLVHWLMREKHRMQDLHEETQASTLNHHLPGHLLDGFRSLFTSSYLMNQALFILLMTWIATIGYFMQTDFIAREFSGLAARTQALADIDLGVNICSAVVLLFGLNRFILRFGVTASLVLNPILMAISFVLMAISPTLVMLQAMQGLRRVTQYAIARPSREICFTVVSQESRYKAKNVIDTVIYRLGDLSAAWVQAGMRALGFGFAGTLGLGLIASGIWGVAAWTLGQQYERRRAAQYESGVAPADQSSDAA